MREREREREREKEREIERHEMQRGRTKESVEHTEAPLLRSRERRKRERLYGAYGRELPSLSLSLREKGKMRGGEKGGGEE